MSTQNAGIFGVTVVAAVMLSLCGSLCQAAEQDENDSNRITGSFDESDVQQLVQGLNDNSRPMKVKFPPMTVKPKEVTLSALFIVLTILTIALVLFILTRQLQKRRSNPPLK